MAPGVSRVTSLLLCLVACATSDLASADEPAGDVSATTTSDDPRLPEDPCLDDVAMKRTGRTRLTEQRRDRSEDALQVSLHAAVTKTAGQKVVQLDAVHARWTSSSDPVGSAVSPLADPGMAGVHLEVLSKQRTASFYGVWWSSAGDQINQSHGFLPEGSSEARWVPIDADLLVTPSDDRIRIVINGTQLDELRRPRRDPELSVAVTAGPPFRLGVRAVDRSRAGAQLWVEVKSPAVQGNYSVRVAGDDKSACWQIIDLGDATFVDPMEVVVQDAFFSKTFVLPADDGLGTTAGRASTTSEASETSTTLRRLDTGLKELLRQHELWLRKCPSGAISERCTAHPPPSDTGFAASSVRADVRDRSFRQVELGYSNLAGALAAGVDFTGSRLAVDFSYADLTSAVFDGVTFRGELAHATLASARMRGAQITASYEGADLRRADLTRAVLGPGAYAQVAELKGTNFEGARLFKAVFWLARLVDTNLRATDLRFAKLAEAVVVRADFAGARMDGADLHAADLRGALNLTQAQLDTACGDASTRVPDGLRVHLCT